MTTEILFGSLLILALVALSGYFAWHQVQTLRSLRNSQEPREDRYYARNQALRRLFGCGLMIAVAALVAGWFLLDLHERTTQLVQEGEAAAARNEKPEMTPDQKRVYTVASLYVIFTLVVFLLLLVTAAIDILAIRRYSRRHFDKINADRRAMIERQAARLRTQRNGHR
jgi:hypothetical protein